MEDYPGWAGLLNVHSWGVLPAGDGRARLFLLSDDLRGLLSLQAYSGFAPRRNTYDLGIEGIYRGIYPLIRFGLSGDTHTPGIEAERWNGFTAKLGLDAPLDLSGSRMHRSMNLSTTGYLRWEEADPLVLGDENELVVPLRHGLSVYSASKAAAPRDYRAPWEQYLDLSWAYVPAQPGHEGGEIIADGYFTIPGLFRHHRVRLFGTGEWRYGEEVPLEYLIVRPRGYPFDWNDFYETDGVIGLEYGLPLFYPDLNLGHLYYLKRIRAVLFAESGYGLPATTEYPAAVRPVGPVSPAVLEWEGELGADLYPASGLEFIFEQHILSLPLAFEAGLRLVYRWRDETFRLEETIFTLGFEWER